MERTRALLAKTGGVQCADVPALLQFSDPESALRFPFRKGKYEPHLMSRIFLSNNQRCRYLVKPEHATLIKVRHPLACEAIKFIVQSNQDFIHFLRG